MRGPACCLVAVAALVAFLVAEAAKVESPPFWFAGNQLDWEVRHLQVPAGADKVSEALIAVDGIRYVPWGERKMVALTLDADRRVQWEGSKLLVRTMTGRAGVFSGGGQYHPPLAGDPWHAAGTLRQCLDPTDTGRMPADLRRGPTLGEALGAR
jgi:hypothetical protein